MDSISEIWTKSKGTFDSKMLSQILSFAGDGKLKDNNVTSTEFRELLDQVPSKFLKHFSDNCFALFVLKLGGDTKSLLHI